MESRRLIDLICAACKQEFQRPKNQVQAAVKNNRVMYCSRTCADTHRLNPQAVTCAECGKQVTKRVSDIKDSRNSFCSRSCAARYNNRITPKRSKEGNCSICSKPISKSGKFCKQCYNKTRTSSMLHYTIKQIRELYKDKSTMAVAAKIRGYGSYIYNTSDKPKYCVSCGYSKFYEVCHIRPVKDFPDTATMAEVHALDNLIALCPNCHWEFDHGMLALDDILTAA